MPPVTLQERKQQAVRDAIWEAALALFQQKGYDETTVDDIAARARLSRRSFFRYYASKGDLLGQSVTNYAGHLAQLIAAAPPERSAADAVRDVVRQAACAAEHPRTRAVLEIAARYPAAREAQHARTAELQHRVEQAFALRFAEPHAMAALTVALLSMAFRRWFEHPGLPMGEAVEQVFATTRQLLA